MFSIISTAIIAVCVVAVVYLVTHADVKININLSTPTAPVINTSTISVDEIQKMLDERKKEESEQPSFDTIVSNIQQILGGDD